MEVLNTSTWDAQTPSVHNATQASYLFGTPGVGMPGSGFTVCWGWAPADLSDYNVPLGAATLNGPASADLSCTLGKPCIVTVVGVGLAAADSDGLLRLASGTCGDAGAVVGSWEGASDGATVDVSGDQIVARMPPIS